jgi:hypothetical protein
MVELETGMSRLRIAFGHPIKHGDPRPAPISPSNRSTAVSAECMQAAGVPGPPMQGTSKRLGTTAWQTLTWHGSNLGCWQVHKGGVVT